MGQVQTDAQLRASARGRALARLAAMYPVAFGTLVDEEMLYLRSQRGDEIRARMASVPDPPADENVVRLDDYRER